MKNSDIWVDINGYEGLYQINYIGQIRKLHKKAPSTIQKQQVHVGRKIKYVKLTKNRIPSTLSVNKILREHLPKLEIKIKEMSFETKKIVQEVSDYYNVPIADILDKKRGKDYIVLARQMCHKLAKELTKLSLSVIGQQIGFRAHDNVLNSIKSINNRIDTEKQVAADYVYLYNKLKNNIKTPITLRLEELIPL